ncbi:MAG: hypothetical protein NPIRA06_03720 [Nitrospirales bacterium]|nr:MAG: hypothetical protein NPIRA06_03720 [Nitrospirales bacterium]
MHYATVLKISMTRPVWIQIREIVETMLSSIKLEKVSSSERRPGGSNKAGILFRQKSFALFSRQLWGIREKVTQKVCFTIGGGSTMPV